MTYDAFSESGDSVIAPSQNCFEIIPSDTQDVIEVPKAIYVGVEGDVTLRSIRGSSDVTFKNVAAGSILDVRVKAIRATGTTAGSIIGLA